MKPFSGLRYWWQAARPAAHGMIAVPLLWGQALASINGHALAWHWFALLLLFGMACQVHILYLNDYADEAVDRLNTTYWLSGGSRVIPEGHLDGPQLLAGSFFALAIVVILSLISTAMGRPWMLLLGALSLIASWSYSLGPLRLSYRGHGELHQAISCGILLPLTAFYMQTGTLAHFPWPALAPMFLLFFAGNIITALPDRPSDEQGGKRSYPVRHGARRARRDAAILLALAYLLVPVVSAPWLSFWLTASLVSAPAILILLYSRAGNNPASSHGTNSTPERNFVLLATSSQVWMVMAWTLLLFAQGHS